MTADALPPCERTDSGSGFPSLRSVSSLTGGESLTRRPRCYELSRVRPKADIGGHGGVSIVVTEENTTRGPGSAAGWLRREVDLTWRMIGDNLPIGVFPTVTFSIAASVHYGLPTSELLAGIGKAAVLGVLFAYIYDTASQARSETEDTLNKPYRPVPAGLATPSGLMRRFWLATVVYTLLWSIFGVWPWALLWNVIVLVQPRCPPQYYMWWKTASNFSYHVVALAAGWQISAVLDDTAWTWILILSTYFTLVFPFEDVRDMDGDRAVGRRTAALMFGPALVRAWFAFFMALLPFVVYFVVVPVSGATGWRSVACPLVLGAVAWTGAARALLRRGYPADRFTYHLLCLAWGLTFAAAPVLLA